MKVLTLVVVISLAAFATGQNISPLPCLVVFQNGTEVRNECFTAGGLIVCEDVYIPPNEQIASMSFCLPKTCMADDDCSTIDPTSACTSESQSPNEEDMEAVLNACFPDGTQSNDRQNSSAEENQPSRCSVTAEVAVATLACRVGYAGATTERSCNPLGGPPVACSSEVACTVNINGQDATLSFCESPPTSTSPPTTTPTPAPTLLPILPL